MQSFPFSGEFVPTASHPAWVRAFPWEIANQAGADLDINPKILASVAYVESACDPWAMRFEPNWLYFYFVSENAARCGVTKDTERMAQATSWGLMQVMGSVARELGFRGSLASLCDPAHGIHFGAEKLANCRERYGGDMDLGILAYNAGSIRRNADGVPVNKLYLDKVKAALAVLLRH